MPSPIAHGTTGYVLYRAFGPRLEERGGPAPWSSRRVLFIILVLSLVPDLDVIPGLLVDDLHGIHNSLTNSILVGVVVAIAIGGVMWFLGRIAARDWFLVALISYWLHIAMDYFTSERGVILFWPITSKRFIAPVQLFYGFHYSEGFISIHHLWTVVTELAFALALLLGISLIAKLISSRQATPVR